MSIFCFQNYNTLNHPTWTITGGHSKTKSWKCNKSLIAGEAERNCFPTKPPLFLSRENISAENGDPVQQSWFISGVPVTLFLLIRSVYRGTSLILNRFTKGGQRRQICTFPWLQSDSARDEINGNWWTFLCPPLGCSPKLYRTRGREFLPSPDPQEYSGDYFDGV